MAFTDVTGLALSHITGPMDFFHQVALYDHDALSSPVGSPTWLKTNDQGTSPTYDIRPLLMAMYTDDAAVPGANEPWYLVNISGSYDLEIQNDDTDVLTVTAGNLATIYRSYTLEGLKTGTATIRLVATDSGTPIWTSDDITVRVIGDSLFTAEQEAALAAHAAVAQKWSIRLNDPAEDLVVIHDETDHGGLRTVTDKGSRTYAAVNFSRADKDKLQSTKYGITVTNSSGRFGTEAADSFFEGDLDSYNPCECRLLHQIYVDIDGEWDELEMLSYEGLIDNIKFRTEKGEAEIETEELAGCFFLRTKFTSDHGDVNDTHYDTDDL